MIDRCARAVLLVLVFAGPSFGFGHVIENPARPKAANAGRVVVPQEVLAISDEGTSDYYFKSPYGLRTGPDGSLVFLDREQILRFDKEGRFLYNLFKQGQGPGEMQYPGGSLFIGDGVVVYSGNEDKLVYFDRNGRFERELPVRPDPGPFPTLCHHHAGIFYFWTLEFPQTSGDPRIIEIPQTLVAVHEPEGAIEPLASFGTEAYVVSSGGAQGSIGITRVIAGLFQEALLVMTHTEDYLLKIYDPVANKVVREFRRTYDRVKPEPLTDEQKKSYININGKYYSPPERKFDNDIKNVLTRGGEIWVVTSTKDPHKGVLIDVFDGEGAYRDCFWLKLAGPAVRSLQSPGLCALDGEFLWTVERAEDETLSIKKYRVAG